MLTRPNDVMADLTIREHFAAAALQGLLASGTDAHPQDTADLAVAHADALIAALNAPAVPPPPEPPATPITTPWRGR